MKSSVTKRYGLPLGALLFLLCGGYFLFVRTKREPPKRIESLAQISESIKATTNDTKIPKVSISPPINPAASPPPQETYSKERFLKMVREDQICEVLVNGNAPLEDEIEALLELPSVRMNLESDQELNYLFRGSESPFFGKPNYSQSSQILDFYNALLVSGLLQGSVSQDINNPYALELLRGLESQDPGNAAYPFFTAQVLLQLHEDDSRILAEFRRAFSADRFEAYYGKIYNQLADKGFTNSSAMFVSISVMTRVPVPNFYAALKLIDSEIERQGSDFSLGALGLGQLMMDEGERNREISSGPLFGPLEYAAGRKIYMLAFKKVYPHEEMSDIPSTAEWMHSRGPTLTEESAAFMEKLEEPGNDCSDKEVAKIREKFATLREAYLQIQDE